MRNKRAFAFGACALFVLGFARCSVSTGPDETDAADANEDPCPRDVPDAAEFSCEGSVTTLDADPNGCINGPEYWCKTCDSGLDYPYGCKVTLPIGTTMCGPLVCTCFGGNYWQCPL